MLHGLSQPGVPWSISSRCSRFLPIVELLASVKNEAACSCVLPQSLQSWQVLLPITCLLVQRSSTFCGAQEWLEVNAFVTLSFSCCIKFVRCFGVCGGVCVCWVSFFLGSYKKTWLAYCGVLSLVSDHSEPPAQQAPPHQWWIQYRPSLITVTERYFLSWELVLKWSDSSGKFYQVTFKPVGSSWTTWWLL